MINNLCHLLSKASHCPQKSCRLLLFHRSSVLRKLVQFNLSDIGEGIAEVQVKEWNVKVGDTVNEFDEICLVQSDKAAVTITSRYKGTIKKLYYKLDEIAKVGHPLLDIDVADEQQSDKPADELKQDGNESVLSQSKKMLASPAVRRLIREHGLRQENIRGTGPDGRVLKEDILKITGSLVRNERHGLAVQRNKAATDAQKARDDETSSSDSSEDETGDKIVPIRGLRRAMVKTMTEALKIPHFGYSDEVIADKFIEARKQLTPLAERKGLKLSYMPFIVKATSLALCEFPILNSTLDPMGEHIKFNSNHNISLAMDTPDGLLVPNIKNCQKKNIWEITAELNRLLKAGTEGRLTKEDLSGGTITLSNIGSIGGTYMSPVILPPQLVIGAIGKIQKKLRFIDNNIEATANAAEPLALDLSTLVCRHIVNFSWSADHRVIDGATMARFSNRIKQFLENPSVMLAEMH